MAHAVGVDLGGTKTAAGVVSEDGALLFSETIPTLNRAGGEAVLDAAAALVSRMLLRAQAGRPLRRRGGGGLRRGDRCRAGVVVSATDAIQGWAGTALTEGLARRLGIPPGGVRAVNDVHAHALGEAWRGAAAGTASSLLIAFGTGVGGSLVLAGRPVLGHRFVGGHVGHFASPYAYAGAEALPCSCGGSGHVEAVASGPAIHAAFLRLGGSTAVPDTRAVFALAHSGHPAARRAVSTAAAAAGQAAGGLVNILDPEIVVVSGGLADAGELWWKPMKAALRRELLDPLVRVPVLRATLENSAAIVGAARLVFN